MVFPAGREKQWKKWRVDGRTVKRVQYRNMVRKRPAVENHDALYPTPGITNRSCRVMCTWAQQNTTPMYRQLLYIAVKTVLPRGPIHFDLPNHHRARRGMK